MGWSAGGGVSAVVTAHIAIVGDENETLPSHRELNAVRGMLGDDVDSEWVPTDGAQISDLSGFHGIWLVPGRPMPTMPPHTTL